MSTNPLAHALAKSWLSEFLRSLGWVWPVLEISHLLGLVLMFGSLIIFDLRILGFAPDLSIEQAVKLLKFTLIGFALSVGTGSLLLLGSAHHFLSNPAFLTKMAFIGLGALNALYFTVVIRKGSKQQITGVSARISATLSLLIWISVITLARFVAFVESS